MSDSEANVGEENASAAAAANANETEASGVKPELQEELDKARRDYLYLAAEFENFKKHAIKERSDLIKFGSERVLKDLLEVVDNFERALSADSTSANPESLREGIALIHKELATLLNRYGVTELPCEGAVFDPSRHEALTSEERADLPEGVISRVFRKAYSLHDRLLRPAQVVVSRKPQASEPGN